MELISISLTIEVSPCLTHEIGNGNLLAPPKLQRPRAKPVTPAQESWPSSKLGHTGQGIEGRGRIPHGKRPRMLKLYQLAQSHINLPISIAFLLNISNLIFQKLVSDIWSDVRCKKRESELISIAIF